MSTIDISTMTKGELVEEIDRQLACAKCRSLGMLASPLGVDGGVKYCACRFGAEQYQRDLTRTDVITAPITREWHLFPKSQYGTPEFLQLCTDQAAEARKAGRLACANALDRYVEQELLKCQLDTVMTRTPALVPYSAPRIHVSHEMDSINSPGGGSVGCCMVCREAWVNDVMTPGLTYPCTKVKPKLDPMTGHPVEFMEREGFGQQVVNALDTIHNAALDTSRAVIAEPRSPMLDVSDWNVEVQVIKD